MSVATLPAERLMTAEEFFAIPEDGIARILVRGEIRELGVTLRNRLHGGAAANITTLLNLWKRQQPAPRGEVTCGDTGFRLRRDPDVLVGPDVAYASPELVAATGRVPTFYDGPPVLAVEVLSPSDKHKNVIEKIGLYLEAGAVVWVVDPDLQTVQVNRPGHLPESFNASQEFAADPYLPGLRVAVASLFE